jgi:hypothetical protein
VRSPWVENTLTRTSASGGHELEAFDQGLDCHGSALLSAVYVWIRNQENYSVSSPKKRAGGRSVDPFLGK